MRFWKANYRVCLTLSVLAACGTVAAGVLIGLHVSEIDAPQNARLRGQHVGTPDGEMFVFYKTPLEVVIEQYNEQGFEVPYTIHGEAAQATQVKGFFPVNNLQPLLNYLVDSQQIFALGDDIGSMRDLNSHRRCNHF